MTVFLFDLIMNKLFLFLLILGPWACTKDELPTDAQPTLSPSLIADSILCKSWYIHKLVYYQNGIRYNLYHSQDDSLKFDNNGNFSYKLSGCYRDGQYTQVVKDSLLLLKFQAHQRIGQREVDTTIWYSVLIANSDSLLLQLASQDSTIFGRDTLFAFDWE